MEIEFTAEQKMLASAASDFLTAECPKAKVRQIEESESGYSPETWKKMAGLGWLGLVIPEKYGGTGGSFQELCIILEQMGKMIFPGPFTCTVVGGVLPLLEAGTESQKGEFLPKVARGDLIMTLALLEESAVYEPYGVKMRAAAKGDGYVLNGSKLFVELANAADYLVCAARTADGASPEDGVSLFIVNARAAGITCEVIPTMGMDKLCEVRFQDVAVPGEGILGTAGQGWPIIERVIRKGAIAKCAESVGGMQASLEMSVSYTKERVQYERPIGAFQALQHWMADMYIATETSKNLLYEVAWMESEGMPCAKEASAAKAYINEAYKVLTEKAVRLHGAIGTTRDHDIGLYFRRGKTNSIAFGDTDYHREVVASQIGM